MIWLIVAMMVLFVITALSGVSWFALTIMADKVGSWVCGIITVLSFISFIVISVMVIIKI